MASQVPFEEHRKLILWVAHKVLRRVHAAGGKSMQFEDVFQELVCAWCVARDKWDAKHGVPFGPYLMRGMSNHINRVVDRELRQHKIAPFDLDAEMDEDDGSRTLHETVADEMSLSPEAALVESDMRDYVRDPLRWREISLSLSPITEKFLDLIENPPAAVLAIVKGLQARAEYGRKTLHIHAAASPRHVTGGLIMDLMGIENRKERASIYRQIEDLRVKVDQQ